MGASIDDYCSRHGTVLHIAIRKEQPRSVETLLGSIPRPNIECVLKGETHDSGPLTGATPLLIACTLVATESVELLLKGGANPNAKNKNGDDSVDILLRTETESEEARKCLRLLLSKPYGVSVDETNEQGQTWLHRIGEKTLVSMVEILVEAGVQFDIKDRDGYTSLAVAISKGNTLVAKYLIDQGADVNITSRSFHTILNIAVMNGSLDHVKLLRHSWADNKSFTMLRMALRIRDNLKLVEMVRYLLDEAKVTIGQYLIIQAAKMTMENYETGIWVLKFLIQHKAPLDNEGNEGRRAVHFACTAPVDEGIRALVEAGAEINVTDYFRRRPIHFAASSSSPDCIKYLLDTFQSADIDTADADDWTPLLWTARSGAKETIEQLVARGADVWARGRVYNQRKWEWSALKLMNYADNHTSLRPLLRPQIRERVDEKGRKEK
ncbi:ankyrin repeat-containing domain protein [Hypoxylon sp. FL1284]|nr:ankyrin repeat-containing domain protein [Hypoxylon sp. FL1284]